MSQHFGPAPCWRVIATRVPSADLFGGITDFSEWEEVAAIENLFNERSLGALGKLALVPRSDRAYGLGSAYIMAPFAYLAPGRFGDGTFGVLYVGLSENTALAEVAWHKARFMRDWSEPKQTNDFQVLNLTFRGEVEDIRASQAALPDVYDPVSWAAGQVLGGQARTAGMDGIAYASVRRPGGECLAGFRPSAFSHCRFLRYEQFFWDGSSLHAAGLPPF